MIDVRVRDTGDSCGEGRTKASQGAFKGTGDEGLFDYVPSRGSETYPSVFGSRRNPKAGCKNTGRASGVASPRILCPTSRIRVTHRLGLVSFHLDVRVETSRRYLSRVAVYEAGPTKFSCPLGSTSEILALAIGFDWFKGFRGMGCEGVESSACIREASSERVSRKYLRRFVSQCT
jgi:hypothetical protein